MADLLGWGFGAVFLARSRTRYCSWAKTLELLTQIFAGKKKESFLANYLQIIYTDHIYR